MAHRHVAPAVPAPGPYPCAPPARSASAAPAKATSVESGILGRCVDHGAQADWCAFLDHFEVRIRRVIRTGLERTTSRTTFEDVDDLVQECYCRLFALAGRVDGCTGWFRGHTDAETWSYLASVARAVMVDFLRARWAAKRPRPESGRSSARVLRSLPAIQSTPEERLLTAERLSELIDRCHRHFGARPGCLRTHAVKRAVVDGWTSAEVARESGGKLSRQQVDSLVCRARQRLAHDGVALARRGAT